MTSNLIFLSVPGLRAEDVPRMPNLQALVASGDRAQLTPGFPCVTWPAQADMLCGCRPDQHGVIANGFYWRDLQQIEMWTAGNDKIQRPQIWDLLHQRAPQLRSAAWFPMLSKGCGADYVCMPAPIHNPDGSESLWCYTKPSELYGELRDAHGHFPLHHFWGPLANIKSTQWIADSAVDAAARFRPHFFLLYLPHLDYAAQKHGPDSPPALEALGELDHVLGTLREGMRQAYGGDDLTWLVASEYTIVSVDHVTYPNRVLREAGLLAVREGDDGELLDTEASLAWALVDHQLAHVFVKDADIDTVALVEQIFRGTAGIAEVLAGSARAKYQMDHPRSGELILISTPHSWQAYYYWLDDRRAPAFARTVDIHRKPGYDPVELHLDPETRSIPLDASRVRGSHGAPAVDDTQRGVLLSSRAGVIDRTEVEGTDVAAIVLRHFGMPPPT